MCFFSGHSLRGRKTHKTKSVQKSRNNPVKCLFMRFFFLYVFFPKIFQDIPLTGAIRLLWVSAQFLALVWRVQLASFFCNAILANSELTAINRLQATKYWGFAKGWFSKRVVLADVPPEREQERGYIRVFPGTKTGMRVRLHVPPEQKTGTRVHSPKQPCYETALLFPREKITAINSC